VRVPPQRRALVDGVFHRDRQQHHALAVAYLQLLHLRSQVQYIVLQIGYHLHILVGTCTWFVCDLAVAYLQLLHLHDLKDGYRKSWDTLRHCAALKGVTHSW